MLVSIERISGLVLGRALWGGLRWLVCSTDFALEEKALIMSMIRRLEKGAFWVHSARFSTAVHKECFSVCKYFQSHCNTFLGALLN